MDKRWINIEELAHYLSLPKGTLYVWVCQRKIPYSKLGRLLRFDLREIDSWMKNKRVEEFS